MSATPTTEKTGRLEDDGVHPLGHVSSIELGTHAYRWSRCVDCGTTYPHIRGAASCNGTRIRLCPWCRPDSRPWMNGRGL